MDKFSYWQRRHYDRWEDALDHLPQWSDPNFSLEPLMARPRAYALRDGTGAWIYLVLEQPGAPPGVRLPDWEMVDDGDAIAAIAKAERRS